MKKGKSRAEKKAKNKVESIKLERFIKTSDDWYPNYEGDTVRLFILNQKFTKPSQYCRNFVRIAVWGADDCGMEMDFEGLTQEENDAKFLEWKETIYDKIHEPCSKEYFSQLGFIPA